MRSEICRGVDLHDYDFLSVRSSEKDACLLIYRRAGDRGEKIGTIEIVSADLGGVG